MRGEPIDDDCAAAGVATTDADHLVRGNPDREREQFLDLKFDPREARSVALVGVAEALPELERQQLSSRDACATCERKQPVDAAKHREDGAFAARLRGVRESSQGGRRWSAAARVLGNTPAVP